MHKQKNQGIWKYHKYLPEVEQKFRISLGEGNTGLSKIGNILFKCEYQNPTGSWKDRGMAYQIAKLKEKGIKNAVITSSGNAAISALCYCKLCDIALTIFLSPKVHMVKMKRINELKYSKTNIIKTLKPVSESVKYSLKNNFWNLRQSTDKNSIYGYETILFELLDEAPFADAVYLPVSSGTAAVGIYEGLKKLKRNLPLHIVQTEKIHPVASQFDKSYKSSRESLADAIVAKYTPNEDNLIDIISKTKGWGWVISDNEILEAHKYLSSNGLSCSYEGAMTLAALRKSMKYGYKYKNPVCILSGKYYG